MPLLPRAAARRCGARLACAALCLVAACAATKPDATTETPGTTDSGARPSGMPGIVIVDMHEEPASDPSLVKVVGTIVNKTDRPVSRLTVRVEARDVQGRALSRVITPSLSETIPAQGGTALFEASVPRSKIVNNYYAEVIGQ